MTRRAIWALALATGVAGISINGGKSDHVQGIQDGLNGIPQELARIFGAGMKDDTSIMMERLASLHKKAVSFTAGHPERKEALSQAVRSMFDPAGVNLQAVADYKRENANSEEAQALLEMAEKTVDADCTVGACLLGKGRKPENKKNNYWDPMALVVMGNPTAMCFFQPVDFLPCTTFDVCYGMFLSAATVPFWWARTPMQAPFVPAMALMSGKIAANGLGTCTLANFLVAPQMPPLKGMISAAKESVITKLPAIEVGGIGQKVLDAIRADDAKAPEKKKARDMKIAKKFM